VLSVLRVGVGWSATMGTGLVIARQRDGTWSAPCAAACYGVGWGLQLGSELTDLLLVIRTEEALRAFCSRAHLGLGGSAGLAVGPVGRAADASVRVAPTVAAARGGPSVVGYSCSKGAYIGVSLEGSVTCVREGVNMRFYGYPTTASQLLMEGRVPQPPAASMLYEALDGLMAKFEAHPVPSAAAAAAAGARGAAAGLAVASSSSAAACGAAAAAAAANSWGADSALSQHSGREDISSSEDDTEEVTADHVLGAVPASAPAAACPLSGRRARVSQPPAAADAPAATVVAATESESEEESDGYPQFELTW
jgi:lipid-binding SYLF domain-containing protein